MGSQLRKFAEKYSIEKRVVICNNEKQPADISESAYVEHGQLCNSQEFDGLEFNDAFDKICTALESKADGSRKVNYRLRDWGMIRCIR